jgi:hypothetical protein
VLIDFKLIALKAETDAKRHPIPIMFFK